MARCMWPGPFLSTQAKLGPYTWQVLADQIGGLRTRNMASQSMERLLSMGITRTGGEDVVSAGPDRTSTSNTGRRVAVGFITM
eukprot:11042255-Alexandrium_andersonii.AAC.1